MSRPTSSYPRAYLLTILQRAVEEGCVRVGPMPRAEAVSLGMSLSRLKRRSDRATASLPPAFLLCTNALEEGERGTDDANLIVMYDKLPDDYALPAISSIERKRELPAMPLPNPIAPAEADAAEPDTTPASIDDFVAQLVTQATAERGG